MKEDKNWVCKHGQGALPCPIYERAAEIVLLRAQVTDLMIQLNESNSIADAENERVIELHKQVAELTKDAQVRGEEWAWILDQNAELMALARMCKEIPWHYGTAMAPMRNKAAELVNKYGSSPAPVAECLTDEEEGGGK